MVFTVFYSWQTDTPSSTNRDFIEEALRRGLLRTKVSAEVVSSARDQDLIHDKDDTGASGMPLIMDAIFDKIARCTVFVPDLTFTGSIPRIGPTPNPNVLIEYGFALKSLGHSRIVPVMNSAFGEPNWYTLPFDMRHLRWPLTYALGEHNVKDRRLEMLDILADNVADVIPHAMQGRVPDAEMEKLQPTYGKAVFPREDKAVFSREDEVLATQERMHGPRKEFSLPEPGARMFLRLIPTAPVKGLTTVETDDLAKRQKLKLQPFDHTPPTGGEHYGWNEYGAIVYRTSNERTIRHLTQLLKNRELWGVNAEPELWWHKDGEFGYLANGYEAAFIRALGHYLEFARGYLELQLPLQVIAGFTGVEGFKIAVPEGVQFGPHERFGGKAVAPEVTFEGIVDDWDTPPEGILMPFFEKIWLEFGCGERPDAPN